MENLTNDQIMNNILRIFLSIISFICLINPMRAQTWEFVRESEGIRLFVAKIGNTALKSFRGEAEFKGDFVKACSLIGDPYNLKWWGSDVKEIKVLSYEKNKKIRYYVVYDVPWPFTDRDLTADVSLNEDPETGIKTVYSKPLQDGMPDNPKLVRVKNFWQKWTLQSLGNGRVRVTLEGFVDPAGNVPAWVYNLVVIEKPLKLIKAVRKHAQSK